MKSAASRSEGVVYSVVHPGAQQLEKQAASSRRHVAPAGVYEGERTGISRGIHVLQLLRGPARLAPSHWAILSCTETSD